MSLLNDLTLPQLLDRLVGFLIVTAVHGLALAGTARLLGDRTPGYKGRLTLNPFPHLSLPALVMALLFRLGWIRPMRINAGQLRFGRWGLVVCVVVSLLATLALVPLLWPVRSFAVLALPRTGGLTALGILDATQELAVWFAVFNLVPVPPLTGSLLLLGLFPKLETWMTRNASLIEGIMVVLVVVGAASAVIEPGVVLLQSMVAAAR